MPNTEIQLSSVSSDVNVASSSATSTKILVAPIMNNASISSQNASMHTYTSKDIPDYTIKIQSDTDWPTIVVGTGSILTALFVGWFAYRSQKNQIRANTANFRQHWQNELRIKVSEFVEHAALINFSMERDKNYLDSKESDLSFGILIKNQTVIELMLDRKKDYSINIINAMVGTVNHLRNRDQNTVELNKVINTLIGETNELLEKAWGDIRTDLASHL